MIWCLFYLLGAFPTGMLVARFNGVDILNTGSGNVGATNLARVVGKKAGILTLVVDCLKGVLVVSLAKAFLEDLNYVGLAAVLAVAGHCVSLPPFLKGGKGVATSLGVLLAAQTVSAIFGILVFALVFWKTRIVSLASLLATSAIIACSAAFPDSEMSLIYVALVAAFVTARHHQNIVRLLTGSEPVFNSAR